MADPSDVTAIATIPQPFPVAPGVALVEAPESGDDLSPEDAEALRAAVLVLESTSFAARLHAIVGRQIGFAGQLVPARLSEMANAAAARALRVALRGALSTLSRRTRPAQSRWHLAAVAASGAVGGAFGFPSLPVELPVSATIMLRSIAALAREAGEDLSDRNAALACLEVFALGGGREGPGLTESSYFAVRSMLAKSVSDAGRYVIERGILDEAAPIIVRLTSQIAARFGVVVSQKLMAQAVPVIGAFAGAAINAAFMDHYQAIARAHFLVRRLERRYGRERIRALYEDLRRAMGDAPHGTGSSIRAAAVTLAAGATALPR